MKKKRPKLFGFSLPLRKFLVSFLIPLLFLLGVIFLLISAYAVYTVAHPTPMAESVEPSTYFLKFESFSYTTEDGLSLPGWFIASKPESPILLLCHGSGENRMRMLGLADKLYAAGFSTVLPLMRGHDTQSGNASTWGWKESEDLMSLLGELKRKKWMTQQKMGAWGANSSAFALLLAARKGLPLQAAALDSPYISFEDNLVYRLNQYVGDRNIFLPAFAKRMFSAVVLQSPLLEPPSLVLSPWPNPPLFYLIVSDNQAPPVQKAMKALAGMPQAQVWKLAATREAELGGPLLETYDQGVVRFFQQANWK